MGLMFLAAMILVPLILWIVACKKYFKQSIIRSILIALLISFIVFALNESFVGIQIRQKWIFPYATAFLYFIHIGIPIMLLIVKKRKK